MNLCNYRSNNADTKRNPPNERSTNNTEEPSEDAITTHTRIAVTITQALQSQAPQGSQACDQDERLRSCQKLEQTKTLDSNSAAPSHCHAEEQSLRSVCVRVEPVEPRTKARKGEPTRSCKSHV